MFHPVSVALSFACCLLFPVTAVDNAKRALQMLKSGDITVDLILAEVDLPHGKGAGMKMLKLIGREEQLQKIPVVSKYPCVPAC